MGQIIRYVLVVKLFLNTRIQNINIWQIMEKENKMQGPTSRELQEVPSDRISVADSDEFCNYFDMWRLARVNGRRVSADRSADFPHNLNSFQYTSPNTEPQLRPGLTSLRPCLSFERYHFSRFPDFSSLFT